MRIPSFCRYALSSCAAVAMLAGCGALRQAQDDVQPPIGAPGAMPQAAAIAAHVRHPVADPTSLFFYSPHPLKFTVRQTGYYGRFTMSDSACEYIASVSPKSAKGPRATFKVTPIESPSGGGCVVSVADAQGYTAKVTVGNPGY
jgi:hypothetical protein